MLRSALSKSVLNNAARPAGPAIRPVFARAYHENVISHYESPRNVKFFGVFFLFFPAYLIANFVSLGGLFEQERL
jgi:hypothetical protein